MIGDDPLTAAPGRPGPGRRPGVARRASRRSRSPSACGRAAAAGRCARAGRGPPRAARPGGPHHRAARARPIRQLRFLAFVGIVAGAIAGQLAAHRFEGSTPGVGRTGALAGAHARRRSSPASRWSRPALRLPRWAATAARRGARRPERRRRARRHRVQPDRALRRAGALAARVVAARPAAASLVGVVLVAVGPGAARAHRRSRRPSDGRASSASSASPPPCRTCAPSIVLRRQLAMELPRLRPWVRLPVRGTGRAPRVHPRPARPAPLAGRARRAPRPPGGDRRARPPRRLGRHHAARRARRPGPVRRRARHGRGAGPGGRPPEPPRRLTARCRRHPPPPRADRRARPGARRRASRSAWRRRPAAAQVPADVAAIGRRPARARRGWPARW